MKLPNDPVSQQRISRALGTAIEAMGAALPVSSLTDTVRHAPAVLSIPVVDLIITRNMLVVLAADVVSQMLSQKVGDNASKALAGVACDLVEQMFDRELEAILIAERAR